MFHSPTETAPQFLLFIWQHQTSECSWQRLTQTLLPRIFPRMLLIPGTGNGSLGTSVQVYSGNPPETSKWRTKRRFQTQLFFKYCLGEATKPGSPVFRGEYSKSTFLQWLLPFFSDDSLLFFFSKYASISRVQSCWCSHKQRGGTVTAQINRNQVGNVINSLVIQIATCGYLLTLTQNNVKKISLYRCINLHVNNREIKH